MKKLPSIAGLEAPFITANTLLLLYPDLAPLLNTVPSRLEGTERVYNAFIALDVLNDLRKRAGEQAGKTDPKVYG